MKYKDFSPELYEQIENSITIAKKQFSHPCVAFDADGTLWDTDLGENFFRFQIDNKLVPLPENPWEHYLNLKKIHGNPRLAYLWLAQINKGVSLKELRSWALSALNKYNPLPIFESQKKIIRLFLQNQIDVYVVTASVKWAVEPGAHLLGIPFENVIGIQTQISNQLITDIQEGPITYRQGKVDGLLHFNNNRLPFFSSGNTTGDTELLSSATHKQLAVSACKDINTHLYQTEMELQKIANEKNWMIHLF